MKYIEELKPGTIFSINNTLFVISLDMRINRKNNKTQYMCIQINQGTIHWFYEDQIIKQPPVFFQDENNNLCLI